MENYQYFSLIISSLVVGGGALVFSPSAQGLTFQGTAPNLSSFPQIGNIYVLSGLGGSPLTVNSVTSQEFPVTQISDNNTPAVSISTVGGIVQPGGFTTTIFDIADNPTGPSGFRFINAASILATPNGAIESPLPTMTITASNSAGASTPFSAYRVVSSTIFNGEPFDFTTIFQLPGDQINFSEATFSGTFHVSSQAIPGYGPFIDQLNNFGPPVEIVVTPGGRVTVPVTPATPVPEPSFVASLCAMGLGAFLKRKLLKNPGQTHLKLSQQGLTFK